jgi:hypothetical protein
MTKSTKQTGPTTTDQECPEHRAVCSILKYVTWFAESLIGSEKRSTHSPDIQFTKSIPSGNISKNCTG